MSSIRAFRKIGSETAELNKVQDNVELALGPLLKSPIIDGVLISVQLEAGVNTVNHTLGRLPIGWLLVSPEANAQVWQLAKSKTLLTLQASAPITTSLWVF